VLATTTRRTQAERVRTMRSRLLDATVECLVETGYSGFSTNDVVKRAGVSRGALVHHFPSKTQLVAAAADRLVEQRVEDFRETMTALEPGELTVPAALDVLWSFYEGPTFAALLELTVAARTNSELREVVAGGPARIGKAAYDVFLELFPEFRTVSFARELVEGVLGLFAGIAIQGMVDGDADGQQAAVRMVVRSFATALGPARR
jgi:AcrR family transcriptional regulator